MHFSLLNSLYPEPYCYSLYYILERASNVFNNAVNGILCIVDLHLSITFVNKPN